MRAKTDPSLSIYFVDDADVFDSGLVPVTWHAADDRLEGRADGELVLAIYRMIPEVPLDALVQRITAIGSPGCVGILVARIATLEHQLQIAVERIAELERERRARVGADE